MISHLQQMLDDAMTTEIPPLGEAIEDALGGLDDEQRHVVTVALQRAVIVGCRVGFVEATAQVNEQLAGKQVRCEACNHLTPFEFDVNLVTALAVALEPDPPPLQ